MSPQTLRRNQMPIRRSCAARSLPREGCRWLVCKCGQVEFATSIAQLTMRRSSRTCHRMNRVPRSTFLGCVFECQARSQAPNSRGAYRHKNRSTAGVPSRRGWRDRPEPHLVHIVLSVRPRPSIFRGANLGALSSAREESPRRIPANAVRCRTC